MRNISSQTMVGYAVFLLMCALTGSRDSLSESMMKGGLTHKVAPVAIVFCYSLVTQIAAIFWFITHQDTADRTQHAGQHLRLIAVAAVQTAVAHITFFMAIGSDLGASVNSFIDYGLTPLLLIAISVTFKEEVRIDKRGLLYVCAALIGIAMFSVSQMSFGKLTANWWFGLMCAAISAVASAIYYRTSQTLLDFGVDRSILVGSRLLPSMLITSIWLTATKTWPQPTVLMTLFLVGFVGFTIPLFLVLEVLYRFRTLRFGILLFALPICTWVSSLLLGYASWASSSFIGGAITIASVLAVEKRGTKSFAGDEI